MAKMGPAEYEAFQARSINDANRHVEKVLIDAARAGVSIDKAAKRARDMAASLAYNLQLTLRAASGDTTLVVTHK